MWNPFVFTPPPYPRIPPIRNRANLTDVVRVRNVFILFVCKCSITGELYLLAEVYLLIPRSSAHLIELHTKYRIPSTQPQTSQCALRWTTALSFWLVFLARLSSSSEIAVAITC